MDKRSAKNLLSMLCPVLPGLPASAQNAPLVAATGGLSFAGVGDGDYGFVPSSAPPDTNGALGTTQFVQWVNKSRP